MDFTIFHDEAKAEIARLEQRIHLVSQLDALRSEHGDMFDEVVRTIATERRKPRAAVRRHRTKGVTHHARQWLLDCPDGGTARDIWNDIAPLVGKSPMDNITPLSAALGQMERRGEVSVQYVNGGYNRYRIKGQG